MAINVLINGANGKMGTMMVETIAHESDLNVVATTGRNDDLAKAIKTSSPDVVVDLTAPATIFEQAQTIIKNGARPVIGTTGLTVEQITTLTKQCETHALGGIIAPNFSLGAVLMMRYAKDAAQYFPDVEIIEMHNPKKVDAPSGTARKTAEMINSNRKNQHDDQPARGENYHGVNIHAVRIPGVVANQMVLFGGQDETLCIRHDTINRKCFMPGIFLACRKVMELDHLVYGLENIL